MANQLCNFSDCIIQWFPSSNRIIIYSEIISARLEIGIEVKGSSLLFGYLIKKKKTIRFRSSSNRNLHHTPRFSVVSICILISSKMIEMA